MWEQFFSEILKFADRPYGVAIFMILLGFIALLMQKTYKVEGRTEVKLLGFGKMKTNYPALVFVFLGFILALVQLRSETEGRVEWRITGKLACSEQVDWRNGQMSLFPCDITVTPVQPDGTFFITARLPKGKTFEDEFQHITYTHRVGSAVLYPGKEMEAFKIEKELSLLSGYTENSRSYKTVNITAY